MTDQASNPEDPRTGLAGIFDSPPAESGLAGLFSSPPADAPAAHLEPQPDTPAPAVVAFSPRTRGVPAGLDPSSILASPAGDLVTPDPSVPVSSGWAKPVEPAPAVPDLLAAVTAPAPVSHVPSAPEPLASPAAGPAPVSVPTATDASPTWESSPSDRRLTDAGRLWPMVDAVLSVAGNDPHIQGMAAALEFTRDPEVDSRQKNELFEALKPALARGGVRIPDTRDVPFALQMAYDEIIGTSVFGDLWRDDAITEIMIDSWDKIVVEQGGRLHTTPMKFRSPEHANSVARNLALRISDRAVSQTIPLVTAELPQARVTFAYGAVVKGGLSITIRKFRELMTMDELIRYGSITPEMVDFLKDAVAARAGVLVSGGTGSGKTTVINLLSSFIPSNERVITIEDAFELQLVNTHVVSLQTKESSGLDDTVSVTLADLLRNTLRMRPDRIIVGEIREGEGALVMLSAATTGHEGTMTTIHANSADMALNERLTDLVGEARSNANEVSIRRSVASAFELVVQVTRGRHGRRFISEIASVDKVGADGTISVTPIFKGVQAPDGAVSFTRFPVDPSGGVGVRLAERKEVIAKWTAT